MTAITAVTAQDTTGVGAIHLVPPDVVREQIARCLSDIGADAIKIGMLGSAEIAEAVAAALDEHAQRRSRSSSIRCWSRPAARRCPMTARPRCSRTSSSPAPR